MSLASHAYNRLCELYGQVLRRTRDSNARLFAPDRAVVGPPTFEPLEPRLLLSTNVAPSLVNVAVTSGINENDIATLSGDIVDPDTLDTFTLTVDWGEGTPVAYWYPAGTTSFSETHQYLDDNPTGTPSDVYAIGVTLTDDDGGVDTWQPLSVANGGFETGDLSDWNVSIPQGGSAEVVAGHYTVPPYEEQFFYSPVEGSKFALLKTDGDSSYTAISQTITAQAGDKISGWAFFDTGDYCYYPYYDNAQVWVKSGGSIVATLFSEDVSTVGDYGQTPWKYWEYTFAATGTYTLEARVANYGDAGWDSYMGLDWVEGEEQLEVLVNNVAPVVNAGSNQGVNEGDPAVVLATFSDPGSSDTHTAEINWGDGTVEPGLVNQTAGTVWGSHVYADNILYTVTVTVTDDDGASASDTLEVTVNNLADLSGFVFDDLDNDGIFDAGEDGIAGVTITLTGTDDRTAVTDAGGAYVFEDLHPGTYTLTEGQPEGFVDGDESAGILGGTVDNSQDSNVITSIVVHTDDPDAPGYNFAEIKSSTVGGYIFEDMNNDGIFDAGYGIAGVTVALTGTDDRDNAVNLTATTDVDGGYTFGDVRPGEYTITEEQPPEFLDGKDALGTVNSVPTGNDTVNDVFSGIVLNQADSVAEDYNFGELRPVATGDTATIGFWRNKNGQALICSLNGGGDSTLLGDWLAETLGNMYGANAGDNDLTGMTNVQVADFYEAMFNEKTKAKKGRGVAGPAKVDAQVMATALATYVTNLTLVEVRFGAPDPDPSLVDAVESYGFTVSEYGVGAAAFNIGDNGQAFGVEDGTVMTVMDLLVATDEMTSVDGMLYDVDGDGSIDRVVEDLSVSEQDLRAMANEVYSGINEQGDIPAPAPVTTGGEQLDPSGGTDGDGLSLL